jgi:hypothetical protein
LEGEDASQIFKALRILLLGGIATAAAVTLEYYLLGAVAAAVTLVEPLAWTLSLPSLDSVVRYEILIHGCFDPLTRTFCLLS